MQELLRHFVKKLLSGAPMIVNIISNPINSIVPIVAEVFKKAFTYDPKKLLGVTMLDVVRTITLVVVADTMKKMKYFKMIAWNKL
ncbi:hypothetical protein R6Q59_016323 [Mikania micrantha]